MLKPWFDADVSKPECCICKKTFELTELRTRHEGSIYCIPCYQLADEMGKKLVEAVDNAPTYEDKHDASDKMLDRLRGVAYNQDNYGIDKYKKSLKHSYKYDWLQMFWEEIADGLKYIENEMERREVIKHYLKLAIKIKDFTYVEKALELLEISYTGKENHSD